MNCPEDSDIRELIPEPLIMEEEFSNASVIDALDEAYAQCCLSHKCICRTCYIPDCSNEGEVVVEISPESMNTPGHCCGKYECHKEPNCTEVGNTDSYWLSNCQRCKCYSSQKICHQSCDEGFKKSGAICESKNLNQFFEHGDTWKDGCYECKCVNGEPNCVINFCRAVNCPAHRQVMLKDSCCPVCWPKGFSMPNGDEEYDEDGYGESGHHYDDDGPHEYNDDNIEPNVELNPSVEVISNTVNATTTPTTTTTTTTTTATTTTAAPTTSTSSTSAPSTTSSTTQPPTLETKTQSPVELHKKDSSTPPPCVESTTAKDGTSTTTTGPCTRQDAYQVYPQVVELMRYSQHNSLLYTIIGCLSVIVVVLAAWNIHLKAKQRSYRPVSNFDDNCNTMSSNIKKMNDYV